MYVCGPQHCAVIKNLVLPNFLYYAFISVSLSEMIVSHKFWISNAPAVSPDLLKAVKFQQQTIWMWRQGEWGQQIVAVMYIYNAKQRNNQFFTWLKHFCPDFNCLFPFSCDFVSACIRVRRLHAQNIHNLSLLFVHLFTSGCFCKVSSE